MNLEEKLQNSLSGSDFFEERKCDIFLRIFFRTIPTEEIRIVGNIPQLGNWSIQNSFPMNTDPGMYPYWLNLKPLKVAKGKRKTTILFILWSFVIKKLVYRKKTLNFLFDFIVIL